MTPPPLASPRFGGPPPPKAPHVAPWPLCGTHTAPPDGERRFPFALRLPRRRTEAHARSPRQEPTPEAYARDRADRRFLFAPIPDARRAPQRRTLRAWTTSPGLRNIYGKTKGHGKKWKPRRFYAADYTRPAHVPVLLSVRFVFDAATDRPKLPARLVLSARGRKRTEREKRRTSNRRIFCASNRAQITEKLRKTGPPGRPAFTI